MRKFIATLYFAIMFAIAALSAQSATLDTGDVITASGDKYKVSITVSPKKATQLLVDQIKSKRSSAIVIGAKTITVEYDSDTRTYSFNGETFTKVGDLRKAVRTAIRTELNIK